MGTKAVENRKKKSRYSEWKKAASIYSPMEEAKAMAQASEGEKANGIDETVFKETVNKRGKSRDGRDGRDGNKKPANMIDEQNETEEIRLEYNLDED